MNEPQVDFSAIRGDWYFHMNFLTRAMTATLARACRLWQQIGAEHNAPAVGELVQRQAAMWAALTDDRDGRGAIKTHDQTYLDFIALCRSTKGPCDALEEAHGAGGSSSIYDSLLEQFTESCRQARGICDDLQMMREQRPDA
jgi:hypothetical protein